MSFWRRIWQREDVPALAACTALDVGTEGAFLVVDPVDGTRPAAAGLEAACVSEIGRAHV